MPELLTPGVYIQEIPGPRPIEGVGTATAGFVGGAERGPIDRPVLVTSFTEFTATYGGFLEEFELAYSVRAFFQEGGTRAYVVRVSDSADPTVAETTKFADGAGDLFSVAANSPGEWANNYSAEVADAGSGDAQRFKLIVKKGSSEIESFDELSMDSGDVNYAKSIVDSRSDYVVIKVESGDLSGRKPDNSSLDLTGGDNINNGLTNNNYEDALKKLDSVDINMAVIADIAGETASQKTRAGYGKTYVNTNARGDCIFLADSIDQLDAAGISGFVDTLHDNNTALYYPWIEVSDPLGTTRFIPPSGAVAGIIARTDATRGVFKAPAGVVDGVLRSAIGVRTLVSAAQQESLNPKGINVLRSFSDAGIVVWGARTLANDPQWKYLSVRRLLLFIEQSIKSSIRWVVFEPNNTSLWASVRRDINAFLTTVWQDGGLFGESAAEAFYVKVDEENNPDSRRNAGQLVIDIGVAPVKPAEFIIVRISQQTLAG